LVAQLFGGADFGPPADMLVLPFSAWAEAAHLETLGSDGESLLEMRKDRGRYVLFVVRRSLA